MAQTDYTERLESPAKGSFAITPSDSTNLNAARYPTLKGIYVGVGGDIAMQGISDSAALVWKNVPAGTLLRFRPNKILATGTTATSIIGLY